MAYARFMARIDTAIDIAAPVADVWSVLVDFDRYPEWNPFVQALTGELAVGAPLTAKLSLGTRPLTIRPRLVAVEPQRELRWLGHLVVSGLFDGEHRFRLEPTDGGTRLLHDEQFQGLLVAPILWLVGDDTRKSFVAMNEALRDRCEGR